MFDLAVDSYFGFGFDVEAYLDFCTAFAIDVSTDFYVPFLSASFFLLSSTFLLVSSFFAVSGFFAGSSFFVVSGFFAGYGFLFLSYFLASACLFSAVLFFRIFLSAFLGLSYASLSRSLDSSSNSTS